MIVAMICPHCGAEHDEAKGRFCDACGMSVIAYARRDPEEGDGEGDKGVVHCRFCGSKGKGSTCPACGNRLPTPEE